MFRFQSRATGDLIMLEPHGRLLLKAIGRNTPEQWAKGILEPRDMPQALRDLEGASAADDAQRRLSAEQAIEKGETPTQDDISLRKRALPLVHMIQRCQQADKEIVWGV